MKSRFWWKTDAAYQPLLTLQLPLSRKHQKEFNIIFDTDVVIKIKYRIQRLHLAVFGGIS